MKLLQTLSSAALIPPALVLTALSVDALQGAPGPGYFKRAWGGNNNDVVVLPARHDAEDDKECLVWTVGDGARIRFTEDGGCNWHEQDTPLGAHHTLNGVHILPVDTDQDPDTIEEYHGWAVGLDGTVLYTNEADDPNANWAFYPGSQAYFDPEVSVDERGAELRDVYFRSLEEGWVVGNGVLARTTNGGAAWCEVDLDVGTTSDYRFACIDGWESSSGEFVLLAGGRPIALPLCGELQGDGSGTIFRWVEALPAPPWTRSTAYVCEDLCPPLDKDFLNLEIWDIDFTEASGAPGETIGTLEVLASAQFGNGTGYLLFSADGGVTWSQDTYECMTVCPCAQIGCVDGEEHPADDLILHSTVYTSLDEPPPQPPGEPTPRFRFWRCREDALTAVYGIAALPTGDALGCTYQSQMLVRGPANFWESYRYIYDYEDPYTLTPECKIQTLWATVPTLDVDAVVSESGAKYAWAVGRYNLVQFSTDDFAPPADALELGQAWIAQGDNQPWRGMNAVHIYDKQSAWSVGERARVARTSKVDWGFNAEDDPPQRGFAWTLQRLTPKGAEMYDVDFLTSEQRGVAVGGYGRAAPGGISQQAILYWAPGATDWLDVTYAADWAAGEKDAEFHAVDVRAQGEAWEFWVAGRDPVNDIQENVVPRLRPSIATPPVELVDVGLASELESGAFSIADLAFYDEQNGVLVGTSGSGGELWKVTNAGAAPVWTKVLPTAPAAPIRLDAVDAESIALGGGPLQVVAFAVGQKPDPGGPLGATLGALLAYRPGEENELVDLNNEVPGTYEDFRNCYAALAFGNDVAFPQEDPALTCVDVVPKKSDPSSPDLDSYEVFVGSSCGRILRYDHEDPSAGWHEVKSQTSLPLSSLSFVYVASEDRIYGYACGAGSNAPIIVAYKGLKSLGTGGPEGG